MSESSGPYNQLSTTGSANILDGDFIDLTLDICRERRLFFLLDTGVDVLAIKREKLIGTTEFEHQQKVRLKSGDGDVVQTHLLVEAQVGGGKFSTLMLFQLVDKQVHLEGDNSRK